MEAMQCTNKIARKVLWAHARKSNLLGTRSLQTVSAFAAQSPGDFTPMVYSATVTRPRDAGGLFASPSAGKTVQPTTPSRFNDISNGSFYQRNLPEAQVAFHSAKGRRLFREALLAGDMENFFFLAEQFHTQDEPTFCGLSTLAMVLNSLRIDPMRTWKGSWRWFNEENLGCCTGPKEVREQGLTFDMFKCLANCNGARVTAHRAPSEFEGRESLTAFADLFRKAVQATCQSQDREFLVICYSRESLGQTGAGHFSPIGGYHAESDSVLIMDVARFKYPPHWARLSDVVKGMLCVDPEIGRPRGYIHLAAHPSKSDSRHLLKPLHVPYVPPAAGRRLASALLASLSSPAQAEKCKQFTALPSPGIASTSWAAGAMCRWLQAASTAEPQVLRSLLQVGDVGALEEVLESLERLPLYRELCRAYAELRMLGLGQDFPPFYFGTHGRHVEPRSADEELGLNTCGELWVLLLLLLPQHLSATISEEFANPLFSKELMKAVRCPWALPLEALRGVLGLLLQLPKTKQYGRDKPKLGGLGPSALQSTAPSQDINLMA